MHPLARLLLLLSIVACGACGHDNSDVDEKVDPVSDADDDAMDWSCLEPLPRGKNRECTPAYEPSFENIFNKTLSRSCGFSGCHDASSAASGMVLDKDIETAYRALTKPPEGTPWVQVIVENPECSPLMMRLESQDAAFKMPPQGALSAGERCAITQWIADGAPGPSGQAE